MNNILPFELRGHYFRINRDIMKWLEEQINENLTLSDFVEKLFSIIENHEVIDVELAYLCVKGGLMTGKLSKVIGIGESKDPAILAYQGLAYLFMNNFILAEEHLEKAKVEVEKINDPFILAEINGILIYLYNARYQFFQGVKILQEMFEKISKNKEQTKLHPEFYQWMRISGAKSLLKLGYIKEAIYTNKRALQEAKHDHFFKSFALLGLGHCFDMLGKTTKSIHFYKRALKNAYEIQAYNLISIIFNRLGMAKAWRMNKISEGENFFTQAISHAEKGQGFWLKEGPQWNLIALYRAKKEYQKAIQAIEDIIDISRRAGESRTELIALLNLGELLEESGNTMEATKVREAAESLASIIGIQVDDFYEMDSEEDLDEEEFLEDEEYINHDESEDIDEHEPFSSDFFNDIDNKQFDINQLLEEDDEMDNDLEEIEDEEDISEDTEDIVRKFFKQ